MKWISRLLCSSLLVTLFLGAAGDIPAPETMLVGTSYGGQILVPSNQLLNPSGQRVTLAGRPVDLALRPQGDLLAVRILDAVRFYSTAGNFIRSVPLDSASLLGLAFSPDGTILASSQLGANRMDSIAVVDPAGAQGVTSIAVPQGSLPAGLVFDASGATIYVAMNRSNLVSQIDIASGRVIRAVPAGVAPLGVAITPAGDRLFVTNWGGQRPPLDQPQSISAGTGIWVDDRGVPSSGTVSVIDLTSFNVIAEIPVGLHPSAIQISPDGSVAAVANSNSDSVTLIDTQTLTVVETIPIPAFPQGYMGSSPTALAFSPTGQWLYVTCGGNNAVAVLFLSQAPNTTIASIPRRRPVPGPSVRRVNRGYTLSGFVPTDWYPVGITVSGSVTAGDNVYVVNSKGVGARSGPAPFSVSQALGSLTIFPGQTSSVVAGDAVSFTNDPFRNASTPSDSPANLGSLGINHVFLIIKENRTYDQVLGDLGRGNGSPNLVTYGKTITPNQHALATQFITLDNYYASGTVSNDGHQWMTQGTVTDYTERGQPNFPRGDTFDGSDPLAFASTGFVWNAAQKAGLAVRLFGEFTQPANTATRSWAQFLSDAAAPVRQLSEPSQSSFAALNPIVETDYPSFRLNVPDVFRARIFLEKFNNYLQQGNLPNLLLIQLPTDHTLGTSPGDPTPAAMMADNDLAVGRVVEAISQSSAWPQSAIFITEDDAQNGVDHVDGHRTLCFVVSPFARRGVVDSTGYNQTSVLRTIEELLGMVPMNKFDGSALPMRSIFVTQPNLQPYIALPNGVSLSALNPSLAGLKGKQRDAARQSRSMNFSEPDAAPEDLLNRILWHTARGWNTPYPSIHQAPGSSKDRDDD